MLKFKLLTLSSGLVLFVSTCLLPPQVKAESTPSSSNSTTFSPENSGGRGILQQINEQYSRLRQSIEKPIQDLTSDFTQGLGKLSGEVQSQINQTIESLGIQGMIKTGQEVENTIANVKTGVLQLDARIQGKNGRQEWNRQFTTKQSDSLLGIDGQKAMTGASEVAQSATDTAATNAEAAQGDYVTQDIMKKIATQNAQTTKILQLVQKDLQEQNKLTATANVNLTDISENLSVEKRRKQNESQGTINAIYRNAAFADGFFSSNK